MLKRVFSAVMFILLLTSMLTLAFNIKPVKASGTIYIRADGNIDPPAAPISTVDNVTYILTDNILDSIVVERNNTIIEGADYTIEGTYPSGSSTGISFSGSRNVTIKHTEIERFYYGISISYSSNCSVSNSNLANNGYGVYLYGSSDCSISGNNITESGGSGIYSVSSSHNVILANNVTHSFDCNILMYSSSGNTVSDNNLTSCSHNGIYFGSSSDNNIVSHNYIANNWGGIYFHSSSHTVASGNYITDTWSSMPIVSSTNNTVLGNDITGNGYGPSLSSSSDCSVSNNNITENSETAVSLSGPSSGNRISGNHIAYNGRGLDLYDSDSNIVSGNNITNSDQGIWLQWSSNNKIYHNNLQDNVEQIYGYSSINVWDDGYPSGGNYWSDYNGTEMYGGQFQNETGSDGIWDHPYVIDANNTDHYPLVNPWVGTMPKFVVGDQVQTTANLNVREAPGLSYTIISTMPLGTIGQILSGPVEVDGFVWWNVDYTGGVRGWSAENWLELHVNGAPTCVVELQKDGVKISEVGVGEFFDIYVGNSVGNKGIKQVRFSSDNVQDGYPTGEWTDWFNWDISSEDWYAATRIKRWAFDTPGYKEVWAEVKDETSQTTVDFATIFVPAPALPVLTSGLVIAPAKDIYNVGDSMDATFTVENIGDFPITLDVLTVGGRLNGFIPPEGAPDFTFQSVTLQPNVPYQYHGSLTLTRRGNYNFFIAYHIEHPTVDQQKLLDKNNWNTCVELGQKLTHNDRVKNIMVFEQGTAPEQYEQLKSRIEAEKTYHQQYQYPPNLLDENSFGNKLGKAWMSFKAFLSSKDLVGQYRQVYYAGKGYGQLAFTASTDAEQALTDYDLENARTFLNQAYRYDMMSGQSFAAAAQLVDRNLESVETLVSYVRRGCELFVRYATEIAYPAAAPLADAFYLALNFWTTTKLEGSAPAVKDALLGAVLRLVFFDGKFISLGDNTLLEYVDRASESVPLDTILASKEFMQEFGIYLHGVLATRIDNLILEETVGLITHKLVSITESVSATRKSPVEIRVFDSKGRITGLINGVVKHEIPMSLYCNGTVTILFPSDIYRFEFIGTDVGTYGLEIASVRNGNATAFTATDIPTSQNATHLYSADWDALSVGKEGVTVLVDVDGNGVIDRIFSSDSELTGQEFLERTSSTSPTYALTIIASGNGTTAYPPPGIYACSANSTVQVTANPDEGYVLDYWELDNINVGSNNPYTVPMQENHMLNAVFRLGIHEVAIINVSPSKTVVGQGYNLGTNMTTVNQGDFAESFNLTLYVNSTAIETKEVTLEGGAFRTITSTLNTSALEKGNYTISAYAEPVPSETNTADNNMTGGSVIVTIPGDVNGDGTVNILDAIVLGNAFLATPVSSNWNPNADINGDNAVNILDAIILANHFLEHYP